MQASSLSLLYVSAWGVFDEDEFLKDFTTSLSSRKFTQVKDR